MAQDDLFVSPFTVEPDMEKHLARNVPTDLQTYRGRVDANLQSNDKYSGLKREKLFVQEMAKALSDAPDENREQRLTDFVSAVWLRYEVVSRSVDFRVSPPEVFLTLKTLSQQMRKAIDDGLYDDVRDAQVARDRGLENIDDLDIENIDVQSAATLIEKVSITRLRLIEWLDELETIKHHFNYKSSKVRRGKPGQYSLSYAVIALADFYSTENDRGDKATVNTFTDDHTGRFLDFVRAFFSVVDPRLSDMAGKTFPEAVRKIAQRRTKDPECYKLLDEDSTTQDLLNFMGRVDKMR